MERNRGSCSVFCRVRWLAIHFENEVQKPGILQVASNVSFHLMALSKNHANLADIGVRKKSVRMRKVGQDRQVLRCGIQISQR